MILYNVTIAVDDKIHDTWLAWMKNIHIPEVMDTGHFTGHKMFKVLLNKEEGTSYSVQYFAKNMAELQLYQALHAPELQARHRQQFGDGAVSFRTVLEEV
jgi:hypothetical protein